MKSKKIIIDLESYYSETAKLTELPDYLRKAISHAGEGNDVTLTGKAPVWLYLAVAHAIHGKAKKLLYKSPAIGDLIIFDHDPH